MKKNERILFVATTEEKEALRKLSKKTDLSMSTIIRQAVREYLKKRR